MKPNLTKKVVACLSDDLRRPPYKGSRNPLWMLRRTEQEDVPMGRFWGGCFRTLRSVQSRGAPYRADEKGHPEDPTAGQFRTPVPYEKAQGKGFLTKKPSARARELMRRVKKKG